MITDQSIKKALRDAPTSGKASIELTDDGARGAGRLKLIIRVTKTRLIVEWYAQWYENGKPTKVKIGAYDTMGVAEARKEFQAKYGPAIAKGERPEAPKARKNKLGVTVQDLFQAYVDHLRAEGKPAAKNAQRILLTGNKTIGRPAVKALGPTKRAADVTPKDIIPYLMEIRDRGADGMAYITRSYISAAYSHVMASENSYTQAAGAVDWGITMNPALAVKADKKARRAGNRYLSQAELHDFWHWLVEHEEVSAVAPAARLIICTGQRVSEILRMTDAMWSAVEKTIDWDKTKNGMPHNVPVPDLGVAILNGLTPNKHGLYFPNEADATRPTVHAVAQLIVRYLDKHPKVPSFSPRDLRRTWKTLAGAAGVSKELRDRIQNHAIQDVSTKHYDRYDQLKERRAAMGVWNDYLSRIINGTWMEEPKPPEQPAPEPKRPTQRLRLVPPPEEQLGLFDAA